MQLLQDWSNIVCSHRRVPVITRAAAFCTDCIFCKRLLDTPYTTANYSSLGGNQWTPGLKSSRHPLSMTDWLFALSGLSIKPTITGTVNLPTTSEKCHHTTLRNSEQVHLIEVFLQMLLAVKRAGCDVWQLHQASNVIASVQSDHLLHYRPTRFQTFSPLINRIVHHALLNFSPWRNKPMLLLFCIVDWYSIHVLLCHAPDSVIYRI